MKIELPSNYRLIPCIEGVLLAKCDSSGFCDYKEQYAFSNLRGLKKHLSQFEEKQEVEK